MATAELQEHDSTPPDTVRDGRRGGLGETANQSQILGPDAGGLPGAGGTAGAVNQKQSVAVGGGKTQF